MLPEYRVPAVQCRVVFSTIAELLGSAVPRPQSQALDPKPPKFLLPLATMEKTICERLKAALGGHTREYFDSKESRANQKVRGDFLRWFLLEAIPSTKLPISRFELRDIEVTGILDLSAATTDLLLHFVNCKFNSAIDLTDATIIGFDLIGGEATRILADRLVAKGSLRLRAPLYDGPTKKVPQNEDASLRIGPRIGQIRLCGAEIRGNLDLRGSTLGDKPDGKGKSISLFADGLRVTGGILLSNGFAATGEVRLNGSKINRNLDCSGARLTNPHGYCLSAAGAQIAGTVYLSETQPWSKYDQYLPFIAEGVVRLEGTTIEGDLDCAAASLTATAFLKEGWSPSNSSRDDLFALRAEGLVIGGDLIFKHGEDIKNEFQAHGEVSLINARVKNDFICENAVFDFPGEEPLTADGIVVSGSTFLDGIRTNGILRFVQADLKQGFYISDLKFDTTVQSKNWLLDKNLSMSDLGGPACGIYASLAKVGGTFRWQRISKLPSLNGNSVWLFLWGSKADTVEDDQASWQTADRFEVTSCEFGSISGLTADQAQWRLHELDRQYALFNETRLPEVYLLWSRFCSWFHCPVSFMAAALERFKPQPYIQLANVFRAAGYEGAANDVLVRLERNKTRYSDFGSLRLFWRWMLDVFLRYGYSPFRPLLILTIWALVSAGIFQLAYDNKQMVATKDNQFEGSADSPPRTSFNALVYAVDTLVPIVDLNQKKNWTLRSTTPTFGAPQTHIQSNTWVQGVYKAWEMRPRIGTGLLLIFNTFFGWLMTTLFAAGVTGLLRTGKDK